MNLRYIDWIWHVRGQLMLAPGQSNAQAFDRLEPLFGQAGTSHARTGDALTFTKTAQAAQDRMSVFDRGVLWIESGMAGPVLRYTLVSRALLFCFLAPLLFLAFGQLEIGLAKFEKPPVEAAKGKPDKDDTVVPLNPVDKFLGAPAPEKPKKDDKDGPGHKKKASPTAAYVFAGIFVALYLIGRVLEDRLVKRLFWQSLNA
ncbi:hypothetical protein [Novosphingobium sp.]|uniref:hypothetical protein n=1 Tax=Novosphingobium sp. TaxID=1874826 RepID=UPI003D13ADD7